MNNMNVEKHQQVVTVADIVGKKLQLMFGWNYERLSKQVDVLVHPLHKAATEFEQYFQEIDKMNNMNVEKHQQVVTVADIVGKKLQLMFGWNYERLSKQVDVLVHPLHKVATEFEQTFQEIDKMNNHIAGCLQQTRLTVDSIFENANQINRIPIQLDQALKAAGNLQPCSPTMGVQPAKRDAMSVNSYIYRPFINTPGGRPLLDVADSDCDSISKSSNSIFWCIDQVPEIVASYGFLRAANEVKEAIYDLRRVPPDCTGAMQHAGAALEAIARSISGKQKDTFGKIVNSNSLGLPPPMDQFASKLWGFASEHGRHIREDRSVNFAMAKSSVICICAVCEFLVASMPNQIARTNNGDRQNRVST